MTVFMTPDGEPFFAGTYFPRAQFTQLVTAVGETWRQNKDRVKGAVANASPRPWLNRPPPGPAGRGRR